MKRYISVLLVLILLVSCNSKKEDNNALQEAKTKSSINNAVGVAEGEDYVVYDTGAIKQVWETELKRKSLSVELKDFRIVKGKTEGSIAEDYYILLAESLDHSVKTAALLTLKNGKFYFEQRPGPDDNPVYIVIICNGTCIEGCNPSVSIQNNKRYLQCTACIDCQKFETEIR